MELDIFDAGKEYISASRAAKKVGYAPDYIGQLCRSKKIPSKLVGRTWYVDLASLLEHKKNRHIGKPKKILTYDQELTAGDEKFLITTQPRSFKNVVVAYESDERPRLPELSKHRRYVPPVLTRRLVHESIALTFGLILSLTIGLATLERTAPELAQAVEHHVETLSSLPQFGAQRIGAQSQLAAVSFFDTVSDSAEFFLDAFTNMKEIAFGRFLPITDNEQSTITQLTPNERRTPNSTRIALTQQSQSYDIGNLRADLRSELEAYVDSILTTDNRQPTAIYPIFNTTVLREEILVADTRPSVRRQSDADADSRSSVISRLTDGGTFANSTLTSANVSGPSGSFTDFIFTNATGTALILTRATSTDFFSTTASSTNLFATTFNLGTGSMGSLTLSSGTLTNLLLTGSSTLQNFTFTNATGTAATTTNFYVSGLASTTDFRANTGTIGTITGGMGVMGNLLVNGSSTLQNFTFTTATGTSATTTNLFATTASSTNLFSASANFGTLSAVNATTSTFAITGNGAGIIFSGSGNHDITASAGTLRIGSNTIIGNIEALDDTVDIGTSGTRFDKVYANEVNATTLVGTISGGNINAETVTINFDNATADGEDAFLAFERGSVTPNALLEWDAGTDRFIFNSDVFINSGIGNGSLLVNSSSTLQNFTFTNATGTSATTTNFFATTASSTNLYSTSLNTGAITSGLINSQTISSAANFTGTLTATAGLSTLSNLLLTGSSTLQNFTFQNATGTSATTTSLFSTTASSTNLFFTTGNGGNFTSTGLGTFANILANGSSTLQNFTFTNATGTSATTTNFFSTTASSTNLFSASANLGALTLQALTATRVPFAGAGGLLSDDSDLTFSTDTLSATKLLSSTSVSTPSLISTTALTVTPAAGSNFNVSLSTTGDFAVNTSQLYVDTSAGNVGIGTTTPNNKLDIYSTTKSAIGFSGASGDTYKWTIGMDVSNGGRFSIASSTALGTTDRFVIDGNGNVGIGTTGPGQRLHIDGNNVGEGLGIYRGSEASAQYLKMSADSGEIYIDAVDTGNTIANGQDFVFRTIGSNGTQNNFYINGDGTVKLLVNDRYLYGRQTGGSDRKLIGMNSDDEVQIAGDGQTIEFGDSKGKWNSEGLGVGGTPDLLSSSNQMFLTLQNSDTTADVDRASYLEISNTNDGNGVRVGGISFISTAQSETAAKKQVAGIVSGVSGTTASDRGGTLRFLTKPDNGDLTDRLIIDRDGNVGIGTTNPAGDLHIERSSGDPDIKFTDVGQGSFMVGMPDGTNGFEIAAGNTLGTNSRLRIDSNGNVGIGTTGPDGKLSIVNAVTGLNALRISQGAVNAAGIVLFNATDSTMSHSDGLFRVHQQGTSATAPAMTLRQDGTGNILEVSEDDNTPDIFVIKSGGNVGIGTTGPVARFHVDVPDVDITSITNLVANSSFLEGGTAGGGSIGVAFFMDSNGGIASMQAIDRAGSAARNLSINPYGGNVGIGTTNPGSKLQVNDSYVRVLHTGGVSSFADFEQFSGWALRMRVTSASTHIGIDVTNTAANSGRNLALQETGGNVGISFNLLNSDL